MNEQLTLQSTQHEETKTVPLRRRKACLAGTFALFAACALVLLIPHPAYAGIIGDFLDIPNMIKTWLLQIAATLFNTYFGVINQTLDAKFISGPFNELFANIVKGWEPTKRTVFTGDSDFRNWYDSSRESAAMVLDTDSEPNQVISLVSCSYNFWKQNERTVVTTSIDQKQAQTETGSTESRQTGSGAE